MKLGVVYNRLRLAVIASNHNYNCLRWLSIFSNRIRFRRLEIIETQIAPYNYFLGMSHLGLSSAFFLWHVLNGFELFRVYFNNPKHQNEVTSVYKCYL